ncbi:MAG: YiiG family protein [Rhizobiales bacterium]|nr:YiiG family protein [Hyphomicrobiales bacterium]
MKVHQTGAAFLLAALSLAAIGGPPALAQTTAAAVTDPSALLNAATSKFNAYVALMNRTLRVEDSINRYRSWVNMKTGPTGKERYIDYGLYEVYDTTRETTEASAAAGREPAMPELDAAVKAFIAANTAISPLLNQAAGYYQRKDYLADKMEQGRDLHAKLLPAIETYGTARARMEAAFRVEKDKADQQRLDAIEKQEGRLAKWQRTNVMWKIRRVMDVLPSSGRQAIDLSAFDAALNDYAGAIKDMVAFTGSNPGKLSSFASTPSQLLGDLRGLREQLARTKGDPRRMSNGLQSIVNQYNMLVQMSNSGMYDDR